MSYIIRKLTNVKCDKDGIPNFIQEIVPYYSDSWIYILFFTGLSFIFNPDGLYNFNTNVGFPDIRAQKYKTYEDREMAYIDFFEDIFLRDWKEINIEVTDQNINRRF